MNLKLLIIICLSSNAIFFSCKEIDLEVQVLEKYPTMVEGRMTNFHTLEVNLSQVVPLNQPNSMIRNAYVQIIPEDAPPQQLVEVAPGHYQHNITTVPGKLYNLRIEVGDKVFYANSTAPAAAITIDSVSTKRMEDSMAVITCYLRLPPTRPVYSRMLVRIDAEVQAEYYIENTIEPESEFVQITDPILTPSGSHASIELTTFSKTDFEIHRAIKRLSLGNNFNPSNIRNPPSNIIGGAIGLFSATLVDTTSLTIW